MYIETYIKASEQWETLTNKKTQLRYNTKDSHQTTRGENKRREEKRATKKILKN